MVAQESDNQPDPTVETNALPSRTMCSEILNADSGVPMAFRLSYTWSTDRHGSLPFLLVILHGELEGSQKKVVPVPVVKSTILLVKITRENENVFLLNSVITLQLLVACWVN